MSTVGAHDDARDVPLARLRSFLVLLVVAHHSAMAYHPYASPPPESLTAASLAWTAFPVVDHQRSLGAGAFVTFNDTFFMALMFLVSGVFVWPSLVRRGAAPFIRDRARRLGIPFALAAGLLGPLAYYPTYLVTGADPHLGPFWRQWLSLGVWPAGPIWFLWVLLVFDALAAAAFATVPGYGPALGRLSERLSSRSLVYFGALVTTSALAYLPLAAAFGPGDWISVGPFWLQSSRPLHYAVYFFAGVGLGAYGRGRGLLAVDGPLARHWSLWIGASFAAFALTGGTLFALFSPWEHGGPPPGLMALFDVALVLSCASSSLACLAVFVRFARRRSRILDNLDANSYGIFVFHFAFVTWLQLMLLGVPLAGGVKVLLVVAGAVTLSWSLTATVRRIPAVAAVL